MIAPLLARLDDRTFADDRPFAACDGRLRVAPPSRDAARRRHQRSRRTREEIFNRRLRAFRERRARQRERGARGGRVARGAGAGSALLARRVRRSRALVSSCSSPPAPSRASSRRIRAICPTSAAWRIFSRRVRPASTRATARCSPRSITESHLGADREDSARGAQCVHRDRGSQFLPASRRRFRRHRARRARRLPSRAVPGRLDDHAATRARALPLERSLDLAQDPRSAARDGDRALLHQRRDPRALPQPDLFRLGRVRRRSGVAHVFRHGRRTPHARASGDARGLARGALGLFAVRRSSARARERQRHVLDRMVASGYITRAQARLRRSAPLRTDRRTSDRSAVVPLSVLHDVRRRTCSKSNSANRRRYEGGLQVDTTLDPALADR